MSKELAKTYDPKGIEDRLYQKWMDNKYFHAEVDETKKPFTIVIPPPNITGQLHMGHALDNTMQDILIRYKRMQGYNALWQPGTDHASIATEVRIIEKLKEEGITKEDLGREGFLKRAWEWKDEYGGRIISQLKKLGSSCDWDRERFTMDEGCNKAVTEVFCKMHEKGWIYKGSRIINWCPVCNTSISDAEVEYEEQAGHFWHIKYPLVDENGQPSKTEFLEFATTRPETMLGDTAVAVNPNDERYTYLKGRQVWLPIVNKPIPVVEDEYVDMEFGTGVVKITPAHDPNDFEVGKRHGLPEVNIMNDDATINANGGKYKGLDRYEARKQIVKELEEEGLLVKIEDYSHNVGTHDRCKTTIEPMIKKQWFVKMDELIKPAVEAVKKGEIKLIPERMDKTYFNWTDNIRDWCISRQLWWGHRIPAYFLPEGGYVVAATPEEALAKAKEKTGNAALTMEDLRQDEDCLDTWFSSWLWPISLFDGINNPGNEEIKYYYPTSDLVTGPDIIFFWVARMIMAGYEYEGKMPFKNVYFTGIVRDKLGRKMSKSLGNSPDPLDLIEKYGADGVRMGMMLAAPAGNDILFDDALCEQGRNFCNKIWNAFRLVKGWRVDDQKPVPEASRLAADWFESKQNEVAAEVADLFSKYRLSEALMAVYKLFWDEFSSWYLEIIKPAYGEGIPSSIHDCTLRFFDNLLHLLHPFMPFITEEIWQHLYRTEEEIEERQASLMVDRITIDTVADKELLVRFETVKEVISNIRSIRLQKNIAQKEALELQVIGENPVAAFNAVITKMCNLSSIDVVENKADGAASFMVGTTEYAVPLGNMIDVEAEIARMEAELKHKEGFLQDVLKKLGNEKFVNNAPATVLEMERKKQADAESIIKSLKESIAALKKA